MGKMERRTCFSTCSLLTDGAGQINSDAWTSQKTGQCVCLVLRTGNVWIITFIIYIYFSPFSGDLAFDKCLLKID